MRHAATLAAVVFLLAGSLVRADSPRLPERSSVRSPKGKRVLEIVPALLRNDELVVAQQRRHNEYWKAREAWRTSDGRGPEPAYPERLKPTTLLILREGRPDGSTGRQIWRAEVDQYDPSALVSDEGDYVATWTWAGSVDDSTALAVFGPGGKLKFMRAPKEFLAPGDLTGLGRSVSHIAWGEPLRFEVAKGALVLSVQTRGNLMPVYDGPKEAERRISLESGRPMK